MELTVVTVTYNRAHTLGAVFDSLMVQTYKDFKWLIVDDGSTDNTEKLVQSFIEKAWFPITYKKKNHAGKYEGANMSYELADTKYITNCDSDDAMLPEGLEILMRLWDEVPQKDYENIWCVTARCQDSVTGELVGDPFPDNINELKGLKQFKAIYATTGEKQSCRKLSILRDNPFPTFEDTTKLVPGMVWTGLDVKYDQYCSNELVSIYYQNTVDGMAKSPSKERKRAYYYAALMNINEYPQLFWYSSNARMSYINVSRCGWKGGKTTKEILSNVNGVGHKIMVLACMPISLVYNSFFDKHRKG